LFIRVIRSEYFSIARAAVIMAAVAALSLVNIINQVPAMYQDYPTFMSLWRYILTSIIVGNALRILLFSFFAGLFIEFALDVWKMKYGLIVPADPALRLLRVRDAVLAAYTLPLAAAGIECLLSLAGTAGMPGLILDPLALGDTAGFSSFLPALSSLIRGVLRSILVVLGVVVIALTLFSILKRWRYVVATLAGLYVIGAIIGAHQAADYGAAVLSGGVYSCLLGAVVLAGVRQNLPAYLLSAWVYLCGTAAARYFYQSGLFWDINGWLMAAGVLLPLVGYLGLSAKHRQAGVSLP
jgi:type IV secretory pathway VirB2 component (pilin)